ncbi:hypothetical protein [Nocardia sp. NPDC056000]|uniref:hypothetical protein n=1 Tax=Nocardia sp. NPDC056000 TaxID=3345674 RepID=UPI0035DF9E2F
MRPHTENPYWNAIVGDNWPGIEDDAWRTLESAARRGAAEMDVTGFDQARRTFDEHIRVSAALQPVQDALRVEQRRLWALADAMNLAAELFGDMAELVRRTCARILDIVDSAVAGINAVPREQDETDAERDDRIARVDRIIRNARDEVAAVMARATQQAGPQGFPELSAIADLLGLPGMGEVGPGWQPHGTPPRGTSRPGPKRPPGTDRHRPGSTVPHPHSDKVPLPPGMPPGGGPIPIGLPVIPPDADMPVDRPDGTPPEGAVAPDSDRRDRSPAPFEPGPNQGGGANGGGDGYGSGAPVYQSPAAQPGMPGMFPGISGGAPGGVAPQHYSSDDSADSGGATPRAESDSASTDSHTASDSAPADHPTPDSTAESAGGVPDSRADAEPGRSPGADPLTDSTLNAGTSTPGAPIPVGGPMPFMAAGPVASAGPSGVPGASVASQGVVPAQGANAPSNAPQPGTGVGTGAPPSSANNPPRTTVTPGTAGPPPAPGSGAVSAPAADHPARNRTGRPEDRDGSEPTAPQHDPAAFHTAVGAAMAAAAAPSFVLGDRVDGDAALARTLLRSILAVVDCSPIAPAWAVAVARHASGISAFVTSNEGRGWLPAGLYLPRTVSTPWVWQAARDAAWEGVADPARVLIEFGRAWGRTSGAEVSAVASSLPIDPILRSTLPSVRFEGEVGPAPELNLGTPAPDRRDRLEVAASPRLLDRVAAVQEPTIALRSAELARDAHTRVTRAIPDPVHAMGTPELRRRILTALRNRTPVANDWWEELRDADDLLAASMVERRLDVSRVPLGELRFDENGGSAILRDMQLQRRCDELVLLLAETPDRQCLRDAVYVHAHLTEHPLIASAGAAQSPPRVSS